MKVENSANVTENSYIYIGEEEMYVENITGSKLTVRRGQDKTKPQTHVSGAPIYSITSNDANFIEVGDNFGFDGSVF